MLACDAEAMLMVNVTKMYHQPDCESFDAFGRVLSGTLKVGQEVKVLGETYSLEDQEDSAVKTITKLWLHQSRYRVEVTEVPAGCWALIEGVDSVLVKTGTLTAVKGSDVCRRPHRLHSLHLARLHRRSRASSSPSPSTRAPSSRSPPSP